MRIIYLLPLLFTFSGIKAQVNGGQSGFSFLQVPQSAPSAAMGGFVVCSQRMESGFVNDNPALLQSGMHTTLGIQYSYFLAGSRLNILNYSHQLKKIKTTLGVGLQYLNYGDFNFYDATGMAIGNGKATDYAIRVSASRTYLDRWRYGISLRYAHTDLNSEKAAALLADIGVTYSDTAHGWYWGAVVKQAGITLRTTNAMGSMNLVPDLRMGIVKRFKKAPFSLGVVAHHLYTWDIRYNNPQDIENNTLFIGDTSATTEKNYFADKLFRHFIFTLGLHLGKRIEIGFGYNHMRRSELAFSDKKGMSGFSYGAGLNLNQFQFYFSQAYYQVNRPVTTL
ncbi:MAG TPA: type IX secretion system protein PorQ, partial [Chitinophagaceae bacterium]|nr:type IX secretion system protein PorQ [Chitinophagaceae bacterium]